MKAALITGLSSAENLQKTLKKIQDRGDVELLLFPGENLTGMEQILLESKIPFLSVPCPGDLFPRELKQPEFRDVGGIRFIPFTDEFHDGKAYRTNNALGDLRRWGSSSPYPVVPLQYAGLECYTNLQDVLDAMSGFGALLALAGKGNCGTFGKVECITAVSLAEKNAFSLITIRNDGTAEKVEIISL